MARGVYAVVLVVVLAIYWAALSGLYKPLLLSLGAVSVFLTLALTIRMGILDGETTPYPRLIQLVRYWGWLGGEILKANIAVAREILRPDMDLQPTVFRVRAPQDSDLGRTVFANSITLTPGTVTMDVDGDEFIVHALTPGMADLEGLKVMAARSGLAAEGADRTGEPSGASS